MKRDDGASACPVDERALEEGVNANARDRRWRGGEGGVMRVRTFRLRAVVRGRSARHAWSRAATHQISRSACAISRIGGQLARLRSRCDLVAAAATRSRCWIQHAAAHVCLVGCISSMTSSLRC